ncbi:MAG: lysylphosphatidylglycerol synthase transmembrane domain-containing protein [Cyclonatronaceae bacterium]
MKRQWLNVGLSILIGSFFLWLALRNMDTGELWQYVQLMSYGWLAPYVLVAFASFWLRSQRWAMLLEKDRPEVKRRHLFTGVMLGYTVNYAIPRLGELSRTVFVAQKEQLSTGSVLGTVVLERIIDIIAMLLLLAFALFFVISDRSTMDALFGPRAYQILNELRQPGVLVVLVISSLVSLFLAWRAAIWILRKRQQDLDAGLQSAGVKKIIYTFTDGLTSIRHLHRWPLFLLYTVLMWGCYGLLTYIPFHAFDMAAVYQLGLPEAFSVMIISTIGVSLPSPGGIGTYHWFVKQSLLVLYAVPAVSGLAYAFVTHAGMLLTVLLVTVLAWGYSLWRP